MYRVVAKQNTLLKSFSTSTKAVSRIGFIGLGNMGASMASNLLKKFNNVSVYDINAESVNNLVAKGAKKATVKEIAQNCDAIVTMLPATKHVSGVLQGPDGIFANAKAGTIVIDCSTIDPNATMSLNAEARTKGIAMLDAPVSGGVTGAAAGTLTFMIGGLNTDLDVARPVFEAMGKNIVLCGGPGAGEITKLCNNLALAISMIGTSEALALGVKLGMDPAKLSSVMNTSTARCWSSDSYNPVPGVMPGVPSSRGYTGGFLSALMSKDLGLAMDAANNNKVSLPLGSGAHQLYNILCTHGYANKDFSSVYEYLTHNDTK
jgi:3-hydroxyisobutyrate dehydrogenase